MKNTNNIESGVLGLGTSIQPSQIACSKSATLTRLPSVSHHRPQYYVLLFIPEPLLVNTILFKPVLIILAETGQYNGSFSSLGVGTSLKRDIMFLSPIENSVSKDFNGHEERWKSVGLRSKTHYVANSSYRSQTRSMIPARERRMSMENKVLRVRES